MPPRAQHYPVPRLHTNTVSTSNTEPDLVPDVDVKEGLAPTALQAIEVDADVDGSTQVTLEGFKCLGSYSWEDAPQPTILVPGSPPRWRDRPLPFRVPFDSGLQIFDPNGYYMGSTSTLIPLFRAVDVVAEDNADTTMDWSAVDFVLDRSSLRKLLRWARSANAPPSPNTDRNDQITANDTGAGSRPRAAPDRTPTAARGVPDFRLDLQLGGKKTVLVERWDTRTCQYVTPPKYGCRSNFDEAATAPRTGCQSSKYHNRIVQYDLEGLRLVVRYEVDACLIDDEDPSDLLASLSLSSSSSPSHPTPRPPASPSNPTHRSPSPHSDTSLTVVRGGAPVPQSSLIELATRSPKGLLAHKWHETYTQLLLAQTPHFFLAVHHNGSFKDVAKHHRAAPAFTRFDHDARMQRALRQLVRVLGAVQRSVCAHGQRGRLSLLCRGGNLELFERADDAGRLPDHELARFGT
ncbi:hypothetical protein VTO73DRAFT_15284 [Trametes versicolor]